MKNLENNIKFKNIFFDFDGVLAESVNAKTEAFRAMYLTYGEEIANKVVEHHILHGGVSRFEKFKIYHKVFLNEDISREKIQLLAKQFSDLVLKKVLNAKEVSGAYLFLKEYFKKLNFWIISGTPNDEMIEIAKKRKIYKYFIEVCGSPKSKIYWTEYLIEKHHLKREETIFIGDATTDFEAAKHSKLHFILRKHKENWDIFKNKDVIHFENYNELNKKINKHI